MRYLLLLITTLTLVVGCNRHEKPNPNKPIVTIKTDDMWVSHVGGNIYTIECMLLGNGEDITLLADCPDDWVSIKAIYTRSIEFIVEENTEDTTRETTITVHFGQSTDSITITQRPHADMEFIAHSIKGSGYYGKGKDGMHNYYVVLSEEGLADNGNMHEGSTYYLFDLYSSIGTYQNSIWKIPYDTYTLENGIGTEYSYCCKTGTSQSEDVSNIEVEEISYTDASLTVTEGRIEARVTLESGEVVNVSYCGTICVREFLSTLDKNYEFERGEAQFVGQRLGDIYDNGTYATALYIFDNLDPETNSYTGDVFQLIVTHDKPDSPLEGFYPVGVGNYRVIAGDTEMGDDGLEMTGSWYMTADMSNYAPLKSGSVTINKDTNDDERYEIIINFRDDRNNMIRGSYSATGEIVE